MAELKPCPFCGSKVIKPVNNPFDGKFCVVCHNCLAFGPVKESEFLAIEAWNRTGYFSKP